ncbi:Synaptotagmin-2 [Coccomyxa sp. Obi]|nr:Synaptotagmin-2 [Coccomyxa sp. Obi]
MSTTIHRLYRAAQPSAEDMGLAVQPPSTSAGLGPSGYTLPSNTSEAAVCDVAVHPPQLKQLVAAVQEKLQSGFHWFEMYIGVLIALLMVGAAGYVAYLWNERKRKRDEFRTAHNLEANIEPRYLARLLGQEFTPSWVKYPDYERMGWINDVLVHLWPHASTAAAGMVRDMADPILKQNKPKWMSNVSLHTFTLGDIPPRVSGCKVFRRDHAQQEVLVEMDFTWAGNQKFQLQINPLPNLPVPLGIGHMVARWLAMRVGVSNINLHGRVRFALTPLMSKIPVVGGVKVSLVDPPDLSYQLILQGGDITFLPGLEVFINSLLRDVLLRPYVWPDGFTVPLVPGGGRELPAGLLYVKVVEAVNVPNMDWFSKTDAYVVLYLRGRRKRRTKIAWNSLHPRWEQDFEMLVHDPEHQELTAVMYNHSNFGADEEIGRVTVPLRDLRAGEEQNLWLELGPPAGRKHGNPLGAGIRAVRSVGRVVGQTVSTVATLGCLERGREPPKLHLDATFYRVGAEEVKAIARGDTTQQVEAAAEASGQTEIVRNPRIVNVLRGGILYVKIVKSLEETEDGIPARASQVRVRVGNDEKMTEEAEGRENPDWEEVLEFAIGGDLVDKEDEQIDVEVWDYHWVNKPGNLTWGPVPGQPDFTGAGWVEVPLREVIERRSIHDVWHLHDVPYGAIEMELQWLPGLE